VVAVIFSPGIHRPGSARHLARCMVGVNVLRRRTSHFAVGEWILDSGAFTAQATPISIIGAGPFLAAGTKRYRV
jgi:hypothetical protein